MTFHSKPIEFWKYRILSFLSYRGFRITDFFNLLDSIMEDITYYDGNVDANFERIRTIVDAELGNECAKKDIILQLHYYVHCLWKNGSVDLPFYTLHNEEHSLELIINYMKMSKRVYPLMRMLL